MSSDIPMYPQPPDPTGPQENPKVDKVTDAELKRKLEEYGCSVLPYLDTPKPFGKELRKPHMDAAIATFFASVMVSRSAERQEKVLAEMSVCIQRQEQLNKGILGESKTLKWLTWVLVALTGVLIFLTFVRFG